eukprot:Nk52_evm5s246 gene=Nk52_evmTU5s246
MADEFHTLAEELLGKLSGRNRSGQSKADNRGRFGADSDDIEQLLANEISKSSSMAARAGLGLGQLFSRSGAVGGDPAASSSGLSGEYEEIIKTLKSCSLDYGQKESELKKLKELKREIDRLNNNAPSSAYENSAIPGHTAGEMGEEEMSVSEMVSAFTCGNRVKNSVSQKIAQLRKDIVKEANRHILQELNSELMIENERLKGNPAKTKTNDSPISTSSSGRSSASLLKSYVVKRTNRKSKVTPPKKQDKKKPRVETKATQRPSAKEYVAKARSMGVKKEQKAQKEYVTTRGGLKYVMDEQVRRYQTEVPKKHGAYPPAIGGLTGNHWTDSGVTFHTPYLTQRGKITEDKRKSKAGATGDISVTGGVDPSYRPTKALGDGFSYFDDDFITHVYGRPIYCPRRFHERPPHMRFPSNAAPAPEVFNRSMSKRSASLLPNMSLREPEEVLHPPENVYVDIEKRMHSSPEPPPRRKVLSMTNTHTINIDNTKQEPSEPKTTNLTTHFLPQVCFSPPPVPQKQKNLERCFVNLSNVSGSSILSTHRQPQVNIAPELMQDYIQVEDIATPEVTTKHVRDVGVSAEFEDKTEQVTVTKTVKSSINEEMVASIVKDSLFEEIKTLVPEEEEESEYSESSETVTAHSTTEETLPPEKTPKGTPRKRTPSPEVSFSEALSPVTTPLVTPLKKTVEVETPALSQVSTPSNSNPPTPKKEVFENVKELVDAGVSPMSERPPVMLSKPIQMDPPSPDTESTLTTSSIPFRDPHISEGEYLMRDIKSPGEEFPVYHSPTSSESSVNRKYPEANDESFLSNIVLPGGLEGEMDLSEGGVVFREGVAVPHAKAHIKKPKARKKLYNDHGSQGHGGYGKMMADEGEIAGMSLMSGSQSEGEASLRDVQKERIGRKTNLGKSSHYDSKTGYRSKNHQLEETFDLSEGEMRQYTDIRKDISLQMVHREDISEGEMQNYPKIRLTSPAAGPGNKRGVSNVSANKDDCVSEGQLYALKEMRSGEKTKGSNPTPFSSSRKGKGKMLQQDEPEHSQGEYRNRKASPFKDSYRVGDIAGMQENSTGKSSSTKTSDGERKTKLEKSNVGRYFPAEEEENPSSISHGQIMLTPKQIKQKLKVDLDGDESLIEELNAKKGKEVLEAMKDRSVGEVPFGKQGSVNVSQQNDKAEEESEDEERDLTIQDISEIVDD